MSIATAWICSTSTRVVVPERSIAGRKVAGGALVDVGAITTVRQPLSEADQMRGNRSPPG